MTATSVINTERIFLAGFMMLPFLLSWYEPENETGPTLEDRGYNQLQDHPNLKLETVSQPKNDFS